MTPLLVYTTTRCVLDITNLESSFADTSRRLERQRVSPAILLEELHSLKEPIGLYLDRVVAFDKAFDELIGDPVDMKHMELGKYFADAKLYDSLQEQVGYKVIDIAVPRLTSA
eukprot:GHVT01090803.1.p2 GENE.GHVT01090803.1~~GHVT01090803.1.p2  ORF type:complete len:113 (+),score=5.47 GHVT01090803.1:166-504(+)